MARNVSNHIHTSTTDPDARLYRRVKEKRPSCALSGMGRWRTATASPGSGGRACRTGGRAAHDRAVRRPADSEQLVAGKAYDAEDFVNELRSMSVAPHVAQNTSGRSSAVDRRTIRHGGYDVSQRIRKRIEEAFGGWIKMRSPMPLRCSKKQASLVILRHHARGRPHTR